MIEGGRVRELASYTEVSGIGEGDFVKVEGLRVSVED